MPEHCHLCTKPETPPARGESIPLCARHWETWLAHFGPGGSDPHSPPCAAHVIEGETSE